MGFHSGISMAGGRQHGDGFFGVNRHSRSNTNRMSENYSFYACSITFPFIAYKYPNLVHLLFWPMLTF